MIELVDALLGRQIPSSVAPARYRVSNVPSERIVCTYREETLHISVRVDRHMLDDLRGH